MIRRALFYGLLLSILLAGLKLVQYYFFSYRIELEFYIGIIAILFLVIGVWAGSKWINSQSPILESLDSITINANELLSEREMDVLAGIARGQSNQEIADCLFVSLNTVKTHISNIYMKLNVSRRTQALAKARKMNLITEKA
ncbi:MAG: response regulator transcription factor [Cyclobacteriaceae bacterium]